jgi:hypothetical protein
VPAVLCRRGLEYPRIEVGSRLRLALCGNSRSQREEYSYVKDGTDRLHLHGFYLAAI